MDPGDARVLLAEAIREMAERRNISLRALATAAGVSSSYLDRVLAGESSPTVDWVCKIAEVLECRPRELLP